MNESRVPEGQDPSNESAPLASRWPLPSRSDSLPTPSWETSRVADEAPDMPRSIAPRTDAPQAATGLPAPTPPVPPTASVPDAPVAAPITRASLRQSATPPAESRPNVREEPRSPYARPAAPDATDRPVTAWQFHSPSPLAPDGLRPLTGSPAPPTPSAPQTPYPIPAVQTVPPSSATMHPEAARTNAGSFGEPVPPVSPYGGVTHKVPAGNNNTTRPKGIWPKIVGTALVSALAASVMTGVGIQTWGSGASGPTPSSYIADKDNAGNSPVTNSTVTNPDWPQVAAAVAGSVAAITVTDGQSGSEGSGVMYDDQGHIVTNNHVIDAAATGSSKITVTLDSGQIFEATVIGTDAATDLAVIKLVNPPANIKAATFGDSSKTTVGEPVMAVGNPLGLNNTATTGIISALNRPVSTAADAASQVAVTNALQMDAAVNPGNSGGPAFNAFGEVIGITSSIATLSESASAQSGSIGLGFAIPSNQVRLIVDQLIESGSAKHAYLGVTLVDGVGQVDGSSWQGAQVRDVSPGKPAALAGIKADDVIIAIDGESISGRVSLTAYVRGEAVGSTVTLTIIRDGKSIDQEVTLGAIES